MFVASFRRIALARRAQVAVIGDYGSCKHSSSNVYSWSVDWGDDEVHEKKLDALGPYQSVHTYVALPLPFALDSCVLMSSQSRTSDKNKQTSS
jgi:hypothetical protein